MFDGVIDLQQRDAGKAVPVKDGLGQNGDAVVEPDICTMKSQWAERMMMLG